RRLIRSGNLCLRRYLNLWKDFRFELPRRKLILFQAIDMRLTNDSYVILIHTKSATERYYRDKQGWVKVSTRGRKFRATAEQVLNHLLPALAGVKADLRVEVEHHDEPDTK